MFTNKTSKISKYIHPSPFFSGFFFLHTSHYFQIRQGYDKQNGIPLLLMSKFSVCSESDCLFFFYQYPIFFCTEIMLSNNLVRGEGPQGPGKITSSRLISAKLLITGDPFGGQVTWIVMYFSNGAGRYLVCFWVLFTQN